MANWRTSRSRGVHRPAGAAAAPDVDLAGHPDALWEGHTRRVRSLRVKVCLPKNASPGRKRILRSYGVEIVETFADEAVRGADLIERRPGYKAMLERL